MGPVPTPPIFTSVTAPLDFHTSKFALTCAFATSVLAIIVARASLKMSASRISFTRSANGVFSAQAFLMISRSGSRVVFADGVLRVWDSRRVHAASLYFMPTISAARCAGPIRSLAVDGGNLHRVRQVQLQDRVIHAGDRRSLKRRARFVRQMREIHLDSFVDGIGHVVLVGLANFQQAPGFDGGFLALAHKDS